MSVFQKQTKSHMEKNMFLDEAADFARYDKMQYPIFDEITERMNALFWLPTEIDISKDKMDFNNLNPHEQHIFIANLKQQILFDSVQRRFPLALLLTVSLPELETMIKTWSYFETIHSRSYAHIIKNVSPDPSKLFDEMLDIPEITACASDISTHYNDLIDSSMIYLLEKDLIEDLDYTNAKEDLWMCLHSINILKGVRFHMSFACSWAFAEISKMEGNAKIMKFICRDKNIHLAATQHMLKLLPKEDKDFEDIRECFKEDTIQLFMLAVEQEKQWAKYLFKGNTIIGLNETILCAYISFIGAKRMNALGYECPWDVPASNPLPWTEKWIEESNIQVTP